MLRSALNGAANHQFFDLANGLGGVQTLGAHIDTVHDGVATEKTVGVFQVVQACTGVLVAAIGNEAIGLQQASGAHKFVGVPPERWAAR